MVNPWNKINFRDLDIDLHTTCTGATKDLNFMDKAPTKSTKRTRCIGEKSNATIQNNTFSFFPPDLVQQQPIRGYVVLSPMEG